MGNALFSRILYWSAGIGAVVTSLAVVAAAQTATAPSIADRLKEKVPQFDLSALAPKPTNRTIDFENLDGRLTKQYAEEYGVSFGRGVSVHICSGSSFTAAAVVDQTCPYQQAANGSQRAAYFDARSNSFMEIDFARPVSYADIKINPTGGAPDSEFTVEVKGFDSNGNEIGANRRTFNWLQDAFTWPNRVDLETDKGRVSRMTVRLLNARGEPTRFLFDDLSFVYAPDLSDTPVLEALAERRGPPPLPGEMRETMTEIRADAATKLRRYKVARQMRSPIDWDAVDATLGKQNDRNMRPGAARMVNRARDRAKMPMLLPANADDGTLSVVGGEDSYHADFKMGGRAYSIYGTRVLTMMEPAKGAPKPEFNVIEQETEYALVVSFSLFGASFTVTRYCLNDSAEEDPTCYDRDAMGGMMRDIVVDVGEAGMQRP